MTVPSKAVRRSQNPRLRERIAALYSGAVITPARSLAAFLRLTLITAMTDWD